MKENSLQIFYFIQFNKNSNLNFRRAQKLHDKTSAWDRNEGWTAKKGKWRIKHLHYTSNKKLKIGRNRIIMAGNVIIEIQKKLNSIRLNYLGGGDLKN